MKRVAAQLELGLRQKIAVVAFGGNALLRPDDNGTQAEQMKHAVEAAEWLIDIVRQGYALVVVHGNGPQVGNIMIQVEEASTKIPPQSLDICVAQTEGSMGYMLETALRNRCLIEENGTEVVTVLTCVEVDPADPAFAAPTKPVGPFFSRYRAQVLMREQEWQMVEDAGRGWRKVVASPRPKAIVELGVLRSLVGAGHILIAAGGGGIPVARGADGLYHGVEAVIDKDFSSGLLARELSAELFILLTGVPQVARNFGKKTERFLPRLSVREARRMLDEGQFPPGSMEPKIRASIEFAEASGRDVLVTSAECLPAALRGETGTIIHG